MRNPSNHHNLCPCSEPAEDDEQIECDYCYSDTCYCCCWDIRRVRPLILREAVLAIKETRDKYLLSLWERDLYVSAIEKLLGDDDDAQGDD